MKIWEITGDDLTTLLGELGAQTDPTKNGIRIVRIAEDEGTIKVKVNEYGWTRPLAEGQH